MEKNWWCWDGGKATQGAEHATREEGCLKREKSILKLK